MKYLDENGLLYFSQKIKSWLNGKSNTDHKHTKSDITDLTDYTLPTASSTTKGGIRVGAGLTMNGDVLSATGGGTADSVDWSNVQNKPTIPTNNNQLINGAGYQTESQVNELIKKIVGLAPEALDTLKELADALGNDPNFATTITTELGKKLNSSDVTAITNAEIDTIANNSNG